MSRFLALVAFLVTTLAAPAGAHHTFVTKYDNGKLIEIAGTVSSVSFTNPHIFFSVDAGATTWTVETESISVANAKGLKVSLLKAGAKVTVRGWRARNGSTAVGLKSITFAGGPTITMRGSAR